MITLDQLKEVYKYLEMADDDLDIVCTENSSTSPREIKALGALVLHFTSARSKIKSMIKELEEEE